MSSEERRVGHILHTGHGHTKGIMLAGALAMLATASPAAIMNAPNSNKLMDRQRSALDCEPSTDGRRDQKRAKKDALYRNPATRWRV